MIVQDDRTCEQKASHNILVGGIDRFMSGWGRVPAGLSYAYWACNEDTWKHCIAWVEGRGDIRPIRTRDGHYIPKGSDDNHCHIYVYNGQVV